MWSIGSYYIQARLAKKKKRFFCHLLARKKYIEKKATTPGKLFTGCSDTLSQSIGRGRIRRAGSLVVRETSRNWSDKVFAEEKALLAYFLNRAETAIPRPPRNNFFFGR